MPNIGTTEILLLLLVALLLFGAKRLPEIGKSLGKGMREFKDSVTGQGKDDEPAAELPDELPAALPEPEVTTTTATQRERDKVSPS